MNNRILTIFSILLIVPFLLIGQEEEKEKKKKENKNESLLGYFMAQDKPIRDSYKSGYLIDNQTNNIPTAKTLEMVIHHRLGSVENGISDIYGIMGSSNTRLGVNYSITNWLQVGFGTTRNYKLQDFGLKVNLLQQSRKKKVPVSVTYYHNFSINASDEAIFGVNYQFTNRFAFFNELLITREFCERFTFSIGASLTHFNMADSLKFDESDEPYVDPENIGTTEHDRIALHILGRFKVTEQSSFIFNVDFPFEADGIKEWRVIYNPPKPNFGIGWEIATATHAFQIFAGTGTSIIPQYNVMLNENDPKLLKTYHIGFNITRLWGF